MMCNIQDIRTVVICGNLIIQRIMQKKVLPEFQEFLLFIRLVLLPKSRVQNDKRE